MVVSGGGGGAGGEEEEACQLGARDETQASLPATLPASSSERSAAACAPENRLDSRGINLSESKPAMSRLRYTDHRCRLSEETPPSS
jgi:hypothetical protein